MDRKRTVSRSDSFIENVSVMPCSQIQKSQMEKSKGKMGEKTFQRTVSRNEC